MNKIINFLEIWVFINKNELEKIKIRLWRIEFEPIENSAHTVELLTIKKSPAGRRYLCPKVYTDININKKSHTYGKILFGFLQFWGFFWPWKRVFIENWMNSFLTFVFMMTYVSYIFLLDASTFVITNDNKEEKIQYFMCF